MALPTAGNEINFGALADNRSSASRADISLRQESILFASGAVGPTSTTRDGLNAESHSISEFGGADYPNSVFSFVTAKLSTTVVGEYVDGEAGARIYWYINDGGTDDYTAGLKLVSDNSIVISAVNTTNGNNTSAHVTLGTIPNIAEATDKYYPFVTTGTYTNAVSSSIDHYDQLAGASINSVSTQYVNSSVNTTAITFGFGTSAGTVTSRAWTFANASNGDNSSRSITTSTSAAPSVTFTGTGTFAIGLSLYGNPSTARNVDTDSTNVNIQYVNAIDSITQSQGNVNVSAVDGSNNVTFTCYSEGYSGTLTIGYDDNDTASDTSYTNTTEPVSTYYQRETINKNLTISSAGTYYPKAHHDGNAVVGSAFIVAPQLSFSTTGNDSISVNETSHTFKATSPVGRNFSMTISANSAGSPSTTNYGTGFTIAPGAVDGQYTITYNASADYSQTGPDQTDILYVYPDAAFSVSDTTLYINSPVGSGLSDDNLNISNTSVGDNISALLWTITKDEDGGFSETSSDPAISVNSGTLESSYGPGNYNVSLRVTGGNGLQNTETDNSAFTITNWPAQALTVTAPNGNILRRGSAFTILWNKTSAVYVNLKLYRDVLLNGSYTFDRNIDVANNNTGTSYSWTVPGDATLVNDRYKVYGYVYNGTATDYSPIFSIRDGLALAPSTPSDSSGNETAGISWSDGSYNGGGNKVYTYSDSGGSSQTAVSSTIAGTSYTYSESRTSTTVTRYFKVSGINLSGEEGSKSGVSNGANIYPILSEEFQAADISFSVDPVEVGVATELRIANVADNIVGYTWAESGDGGMSVTSGTASTGDRDGSSDDGTGLINESNITVTFDTAEQDKTVSLTLYGRNSQTVTRTKDIDVELVDALTISGISNTNGTNSITVSGNQSGFQSGVTVGLATSANPTSFIGGLSREEATNPDSRFTLRSYSESFTPADQVTTQQLVGRVKADGESDALNTDAFYYYPQLKAGRNQITPSSATITTAQTVTFTTPQTATDNVTKYVYSDTTGGSSISNSTQGDGSSVISHTNAVFDPTTVAVHQVTLTVSGLSSQNNVAGGTAAITVNYNPEVTLVSVTGATATWYTSTSLSVNTGWQGFGLTVSTDNLQMKLFNSSNVQVGSTQTTLGSAIGQGSAGGTANYTRVFGTVATAATGYYFKAIAYDDELDASFEKNSATFDIQGVTQYIIGGQKITYGADPVGYNSLLDAADSTETGGYFGANQNTWAIVGSLSDGVVLYDDSGLGSGDKFDGNYKYFYYGSQCFKVKGDTLPRGEIDDIRSRNPNSLTTPTAAADGTSDIDLTVPSSNTIVARRIGVHSSVTINGSNTATWTPTQSTSYSVVKSMASVFGASLATGTSYTFKVRGENDYTNGAYSSTVTVSTDSAATSWGSPGGSVFSNFTMEGDPFGVVTAEKTLYLNQGSGDTTISRTTSTAGITFAYKTSSGGTYSSYTTSATFSFTSGTLYIKFYKSLPKLGSASDTFRFTNAGVYVDRVVTYEVADEP